MKWVARHNTRNKNHRSTCLDTNTEWPWRVCLFLAHENLGRNILFLHPNGKESKQPPRRMFRKNIWAWYSPQRLETGTNSQGETSAWKLILPIFTKLNHQISLQDIASLPFAGAAPLNVNADHMCLQSNEKSPKFHWAGQSNISKSSCCW